jgi:hypothetical protein
VARAAKVRAINLVNCMAAVGFACEVFDCSLCEGC